MKTMGARRQIIEAASQLKSFFKDVTAVSIFRKLF